MEKTCRHCDRPFSASNADACTIEYGKGKTLDFCHPRCRLDWLDKLPDGSIMVKHNAELEPWAVLTEGGVE